MSDQTINNWRRQDAIDRGLEPGTFVALREFVGLWSGWLVVGFMLGGVLGRRSFGGL